MSSKKGGPSGDKSGAGGDKKDARDVVIEGGVDPKPKEDDVEHSIEESPDGSVDIVARKGTTPAARVPVGKKPSKATVPVTGKTAGKTIDPGEKEKEKNKEQEERSGFDNALPASPIEFFQKWLKPLLDWTADSIVKPAYKYIIKPTFQRIKNWWNKEKTSDDDSPTLTKDPGKQRQQPDNLAGGVDLTSRLKNLKRKGEDLSAGGADDEVQKPFRSKFPPKDNVAAAEEDEEEEEAERELGAEEEEDLDSDVGEEVGGPPTPKVGSGSPIAPIPKAGDKLKPGPPGS